VQEASPPRIRNPLGGTVVFLLPGIDPERQEIPLEVDSTGRASEVFWFVDGKLLAKSPADARVWLTPTLGEHTIRVVDAAGRGDSVRIRVEAI
jgi:penicillin-binding protein 1C